MVVGQIFGLCIISLPGHVRGGKSQNRAHDKIVVQSSIQETKAPPSVPQINLAKQDYDVLWNLARPQGTVYEINALQISIDA